MAAAPAGSSAARPCRSSDRQRFWSYTEGEVVRTKSVRMLAKRSGNSSCGKCPAAGMTSMRAPGIARRARIEVMPAAGHFPHEEFPDRFASILTDFVRTTSPSVYDQNLWRSLLRQGGAGWVVRGAAIPLQRRPVHAMG